MGSFHTITTHGISGSTTFSSMGSSISTGCVSTGAVSTGAVEGIEDTIRRPSHEEGAMSRWRFAPRHRALVPADGAPLPHSREHVPREEREDRQDDDHDRRVLDRRVPHERVRLGLIDRRFVVHVLILLVSHPVTSSRSAGAPQDQHVHDEPTINEPESNSLVGYAAIK